MIKIVSYNELLKEFESYPPTSQFEKKRYSLTLDMFNNPLVDALYLNYYEDDCFIGECVLVFFDRRDDFEFEYEKDILNRNKTCLLKNLWIMEKHRGKGMFTKFFSEIKTLVKQKGYDKIIFAVADNNAHAIEVYKHLNCKETGEKYFYNDVGNMTFMEYIIWFFVREK